MKVYRFRDAGALGRAAAARAAELLRSAIAARGTARIIAATGASQFEFLAELVRQPGVSWRQVELFHLDEYIGLPITHPASFRKYLLERLIQPAGIEHYHLLEGDAPDPAAVARAVGSHLQQAPVDVAFVGIGENGHLAFNDPPADFHTEEPYLIVNLDDACRRQQVGEGWYRSLDEVPRQAISMSIRQILKAHTILCIVPELRKAEAVERCLDGPITPLAPASALRWHPAVEIFLDVESASRLRQTPIIDR